MKPKLEKMKREIMELFDVRVEKLSKADYFELLEDIYSDLEGRYQAALEERDAEEA